MRAMLVTLAVLLVGCGGAGTEADYPAGQIELNEKMAVARLLTVSAAEIQAHSLGIVDTDSDGQGEYAYLQELSGGLDPRAPGAGLSVPLLDQGFRRVSAGGYVSVGGYNFRLYLPGEGGAFVAEDRELPDGVSADAAESRWICYAWPTRYGVTGKRTFVVNQVGTVRGLEAAQYSGPKGPSALAAFEEPDAFAANWRSAE